MHITVCLHNLSNWCSTHGLHLCFLCSWLIRNWPLVVVVSDSCCKTFLHGYFSDRLQLKPKFEWGCPGLWMLHNSLFWQHCPVYDKLLKSSVLYYIGGATFKHCEFFRMACANLDDSSDNFDHFGARLANFKCLQV